MNNYVQRAVQEPLGHTKMQRNSLSSSVALAIFANQRTHDREQRRPRLTTHESRSPHQNHDDHTDTNRFAQDAQDYKLHTLHTVVRTDPNVLTSCGLGWSVLHITHTLIMDDYLMTLMTYHRASSGIQEYLVFYKHSSFRNSAINHTELFSLSFDLLQK